MENFLRKKAKSCEGDHSAKPGTAEIISVKKKSRVPWVEKYRPAKVEDVVQQDEVVSVLKKVLSGADLPNLLFYGPPGTGKTSTILAMARELFGDAYRSRILELNASDERGIQVVREKVKNFAQQTASNVKMNGKNFPALKIIILDEADSMTVSAQAALRRIMEKETKSTRFCLICNYISRIIEPLTSRCSKFRFKQLSDEAILKRLRYISVEEGVKCQDDALKVLIETSDGDLRRAITTLQSALNLKGKDVEVKVEDVYEIAGVIPARWIEDLMKLCGNKTTSYDKLDKCIQSLIAEGFAASQVFIQIHDIVVNSATLTDEMKANICECLAISEYRLTDGADEYLQLMFVATTIMKSLRLNS
ncbi:hypothetical protein CHUAL_010188 [Chamberlinius hualienensis]